MSNPYKISRFQGGIKGTTYTCLECGKKTRETGDSESSVSLCAKCYEDAGLYNQHQDDHSKRGPDPDCKWCKENGWVK
jgi:hypothetical protein